MTLKQTLAKLSSLGTEKMREFNKKNGADDNQYGVKMGDLRVLAKEIKTNHELAKQLWETGNIDAQLLALLICQPKRFTVEELDAMAPEIRIPQVADWFNAYIIKDHPGKELLREKWMKAKDPMQLRAAWSLTAGKVARDAVDINLPALLQKIEKEMPKAHPWVQWTMNSTLAQIGIHHPALRNQAIVLGEKMGIYRDYPVSKGCTSPFAPIWIEEMVRRAGV